jgi:hypothetical protein
MGATKTIVSTAMTDPGFRAQLLKDPKRALESLGMHLPAGVSVQVHENSATVVHIVLPGPEIPTGQGLSDRDLDTVAGGATLGAATKFAAPALSGQVLAAPVLKPMPGTDPIDPGVLPPLPGGGRGPSPIGMATFGAYTGCCS